jgi:pimeloyl-ACP methyl ester carboxylesterase
MTQVTTPGGIALEYETFGSPDDPPLLMVAGFGMQLIEWPLAFCELLAAGGRYVICFDNRDCGLSQKLDGQGGPLEDVVAAAVANDADAVQRLAAYSFSDMSDDALALLTALGIERAHVLGVSMGGMIAQTMAIEHAERVVTLTSIMSSTGEQDVGQPTEEALVGLLSPSPPDREAYVASSEQWLTWHSKRYPEAEAVRALAAATYDRSFYPQGSTRQLAAMVASGPRAEALARLAVPTLVIHGLDDTLIAPSGGERTAALVPGAELLLVEDMGHDRPRPLWPTLRDAILKHTASATHAA